MSSVDFGGIRVHAPPVLDRDEDRIWSAGE
jgi:hypothetical protein